MILHKVIPILIVCSCLSAATLAREVSPSPPTIPSSSTNYIPNVGMLPFAKKRDLAIFELQRPLPHHHHGLTFSLDELQVGQEVDIYGYTKGMINPIRKLTRFPATFKAPTTSGLLAFDYQLSAGKPIRISVAGAKVRV